MWKSAAEMHKAVDSIFADSDILIMAAAVADFTPKNKQESKIRILRN